MTPNNNRAVVRYANPISNGNILTVFKLDGPFPGTPVMAQIGGGTLKSGNQTTVSAFSPVPYQPSDRVEATNAFAVSIGSGDSSGGSFLDDETYIELVDLTSNPPSLVTQFVYGPLSGAAWDRVGRANDLAITRDSEWAVVNSDNWIHVIFTAGLPGAWIVYPFHIGDVDYSQNPPVPSFNNPCSPNQAVDTVAVTNERAIVTTGRGSGPSGTFRTWVYIVDLTTTPPQIVLQDELVPPATWNPDEYGDRPHDVAITQGALADKVAVVTTTHGIAAYNLTTNARVGNFLFDPDEVRFYQRQVDSVELTDRRAVVLADDTTGLLPRWSFRVLDVSQTGGLTLLQRNVDSGDGPSRSHDLAIDKDLDIALVRTSFNNVVIRSLGTPPVSITVLTSPNGSDAHAYTAFKGQTGFDVFSSDSVVIVEDQNGLIHGATIGGYPAGNLWQGAADILDLSASPPVLVSQVAIAPNTPSNEGCVPVDLAFNAAHDELVVRSADAFQEASPAAGPDLVRISLATQTITASFGGSGTVMGLDSLGVQPNGFLGTAKRVLSISQQELTSSGDDYTHRDK